MEFVDHEDIEKQYNQYEMEAEILEMGLARLTGGVLEEAPQGLGEKY
jgi:hypothetical protein